MLSLLRCFFAHLLILQYPDHHQNLISSYLYYSGPIHKISSQSVHNFLSNVVHRQTNRQTNATKNITSFAKEVITKNVFAVACLDWGAGNDPEAIRDSLAPPRLYIHSYRPG